MSNIFKGTKIILTGASSTGKTTVLNMLKEIGIPAVTEVVRNIQKSTGIQLNEAGNDSSQEVILNAVLESLRNKDTFVADRGPTDVLGYSRVALRRGQMSQANYERQLDILEQFVDAEENQNILYIYFPIEFPTIDDGVRSTDEEYRKEVDACIQWTLSWLGLQYLRVTGTPEQRCFQILNAICLDKM